MADRVMSLHTHHNIHQNSLTAYREERPKLNGRKKIIFDYVCRHGACTDREIMSALGFREPNATRPRVTELIQLGILREVDSIKCDITGKSVRRVDVNYTTPEQRKLFV